MATPTPGKYKRDVGSGEQLGSGDATELNASLVAGNEVEASLAGGAIAPPTDVQFADKPEPDYQPAGEIEDILFGPAEGVRTPGRDPNRPVPNSIIRALPALTAVVSDPSTPPAIRAAYNLILQRIEAEYEATY